MIRIAPLFLLAACASAPEPPRVVPSLEPRTVIIREDVSKIFSPILLSRQDVLTEGTQNQVRDHNVIYWCLFKAERPEGFDSTLCRDKKP